MVFRRRPASDRTSSSGVASAGSGLYASGSGAPGGGGAGESAFATEALSYLDSLYGTALR